jgi:hypothetical protein
MYRDKHSLKAFVTVHFHDMARTLNLTLAAIRNAQGKRNPGDFEPGTPEWHAVVEVFAAELLERGYMEQLSMATSLRRGGETSAVEAHRLRDEGAEGS